MSSLEKVRPCSKPLFLSQKMEQKLQAEHYQPLKPRSMTAPGQVYSCSSGPYLPEKKMPSTAAKATSRSAKLPLHHNANVRGDRVQVSGS